MGKKNRDPREKALEQEFMDRGYHKDASGRIHVDQPSQSQLMMAAVGKQPSAERVKHPSSDPAIPPPSSGPVIPDEPSGTSEPP
jgi:hypothetical protein